VSKISNKKSNFSYLPSPLSDLTKYELFLLTKIPLYLLEGFIEGKWKPNHQDRKILTEASRYFYRISKSHKQAFVDRLKYRSVQPFLSLSEKEELFNQPEKYTQKLDQLIAKYWDMIIQKGGQ